MKPLSISELEKRSILNKPSQHSKKNQAMIDQAKSKMEEQMQKLQ